MFNNAMLICFELYPRWVPLYYGLLALEFSFMFKV